MGGNNFPLTKTYVFFSVQTTQRCKLLSDTGKAAGICSWKKEKYNDNESLHDQSAKHQGKQKRGL